MPYTKSISVHATPYRTINYILNSNKTENLLYVSGINCSESAKTAYEEMKMIYEGYAKQPFEEVNGINQKTSIKLFHFVQSFRPTDNITPQQAHDIANEWASRTFGNRQILIATHTDKGHIHSHIVFNPYDFNGKRYHGNKETLNDVRELSDTIALKYGIEPTQRNKVTKGVSYKEWLERKNSTSWKQQIKDSIDKYIYLSESIEDLFENLEKQGYIVKHDKHITVSIPTAEDEKKKCVRIDNVKSFGEGYDAKSLTQRIKVALEQKVSEHKKSEIAKEKKKVSPLELLYAQRIHQVAQLVRNGEKIVKKHFKKMPYSVENDYEVFRLAKQLQVIQRDNIANICQLEKMITKTKETYESTRNELNRANELQRAFKSLIEQAEVYKSLVDIPPTQLSEFEKLQLKLSTQILANEGVHDDSDIQKIHKAYEINERKINKLNARFEILEKRYSEYIDISEKYKEISQKDYIDKLKKEKQLNDIKKKHGR